MSKFSGKCDFYDDIEIFGLECILNCKVYVGDSKNPLDLKSIKDCIPYYPYVVTRLWFIGNYGEIRLTNKSWVDIEIEQYGYREICDIYRKYLKEEINKYKEK